MDSTGLVTSTSPRRTASTSPIRAEVPSMIAPIWPTGLRPEMWLTERSYWAAATRITLTSGAVSGSGVCGSR